MVGMEHELQTEAVPQGRTEGVQRAVAHGMHSALLAPDHHHRLDLGQGGFFVPLEMTFEHIERLQAIAVRVEQVFALEGVEDHLRGEFVAVGVGHLLDHPAESRLHLLGQLEAELVVHDVGHPALARLAVDADDGLVGATQILGIDGQVGHVPQAAFGEFHRAHALVDGILVRAGEGGVDQFAGIGVAGMHLHLGAALEHVDHPVDAREIQVRVHALGEQVERQGDDVHVAGALAVAEQGALHPVGAGHERQFGGGHRLAAIIVGVHADDRAVAVLHVPAEPLDLVGVDVRGGHLHRGRQVDDHRVLRGRLPHVHHRLADLQGEIQFRAGEALRRILVAHAHIAVPGLLADEPGTLDAKVDDLPAAHAENHLALQGGGGVVQVHHRLARPLDGGEGLADELLSRLGEHLHEHAVRDVAAVDEQPEEIELDLGGRGETDLDLLEADLDQQPEHLQLLLQVHRLDEGLVAVAQIDAAPHRRPVDDPVRPGAVRQPDWRVGPVLF